MFLRRLPILFLLGSFAISQASAPPRTPDGESNAPLIAEWKALPVLNGNNVKGSIVVTNQSDDDFDQTVIVEAVNEIGKAFALGYQHFTLRKHSSSPLIRFDATLPPGHYEIHADAVAEVPSKHAIHRMHLQAPAPLVVTTI